MWPVMTLTLLLQLTDEEQLYAQRPVDPAPVTMEAPAPPSPPTQALVLAAEEIG